MAQSSFQRAFLCLVLAFLCSGIQAANILADSWIQIATPVGPPTARYSHTAVYNLVNKSMVVFGGASGSTAYNDISKYTVDTDLWDITVTPTGVTPAARFGHSAAVTGLNTMVVFGGRNSSLYYNDVAIYDLVSDSWLPIMVTGTPPSPRAHHTAVVDRYMHDMYVFGGENDGDVYSDLYKLDLDTFAWSQMKPNGSIKARCAHSAVMTPMGVMVVFGGEGLADVVCYLVKNQTWYECLTDSSPAPSVRYGHSAVVSPLQQMTVFGGRNSAGNPVNDVWNFDLSLFKWSVVVPGGLPIDARAYHTGVATAFGSMIIFGGINSDNSVLDDFGLYNLANTVLRNANDGAVMVVLITLLGTILIAMCFAMDYMQEQGEIEKEEAIEKAKMEQLLLPKLPHIPKALHIPLGPRAQKFFDEFKMSLDPMADPPK